MLVVKKKKEYKHKRCDEFWCNSDKWYKNRIIILGDASHAISPFGGQGANQAIYDAICLGNLIKNAKLNNLKDNTNSFFNFKHFKWLILNEVLKKMLFGGVL